MSRDRSPLIIRCLAPTSVWVLLSHLLTGVALGQLEYERAPINYLTSKPDDPITTLQRKLDKGDVSLRYDKESGYLPAVLSALRIPVSSQNLVFSKTSLQFRKVSPHNPRAIYFADDVYVGFIRGSDVLEISTVDSKLGANFYTLRQSKSASPHFRRVTHECLQCHGGRLSNGVPGHIVRSLYTDHDGQPVLRAGTYLSDHTSPFTQRFGGWFVTGSHGKQRHLGNLFTTREGNPRDVDTSKGANLTDLKEFFAASGYLSSQSDIVALMVLQHQVTMHNLITRANFLTRTALHDTEIINRALERPKGYQSDSTKRRIRSASEPVVEYMLFAGEAKLTARIRGTTKFAQDFAKRGITDRRRRSLRELDMQRRMFKYPCSFVVHSKSFLALPKPAREHVFRRLGEILNGNDKSERFQHLTEQDRSNLRQILRDTRPELRPYLRP